MVSTKEDAEAAIAKFAITDEAGCQELHDYWYVFRESKRQARLKFMPAS
jgi:hypothetical protein